MKTIYFFSIVNSILTIILVYVYVIRPYFLFKKEFNCLNCGNCCRFKVGLNDSDIKRISEKHKDFIIQKKVFFRKFNYLKKLNGRCIFLGYDPLGKSFCKINDIKPLICRNYPKQDGLFGNYRDMRCKTFKINLMI